MAEAQHIGDTLRRLRRIGGLSQADLSERAGVSAATISDLEGGKRGVPRPSTLRKLARALGVEVSDFFTAESSRPKARPVAGSLEWALEVSPEEFGDWISGVVSVAELDRLGRALMAEHNNALEEHDWPKAGDLYEKRKTLWERWKELDPPLAEVQYRPHEKPRVVFYREPTPEERAELEEKLGEFEAVEPVAALS